MLCMSACTASKQVYWLSSQSSLRVSFTAVVQILKQFAVNTGLFFFHDYNIFVGQIYTQLSTTTHGKPRSMKVGQDESKGDLGILFP